MRITKPNLAWLTDPEVFGVNRVKAHSDHKFYLDGERALAGGPMELCQNLSGNVEISLCEKSIAQTEWIFTGKIIDRRLGLY